ncbi:hypothetical protein AAC387_Pa06g2130 [Persea americana]|eukprot:TRINITY_DN7044_c0_g1_i3.p1 TRINITY_DN7044_c0_g1~~TRINITY_DN7044_c0_g1_i3.p1  ORF type:complete len:313 (-),score=55.34 TRINITY_DN7044_c0_g1_i3:329-1267(-)
MAATTQILSFSYAPLAHPSNSRACFLLQTQLGTPKVFCWKSARIDQTHLRFGGFVAKNSSLRLGSARDSKQLTQEFTANGFELRDENDNSSDLFEELEVRFLRFKKHQFLANSARFQQLAEAQAPKFMVIACADSRVCPSSILGFQPGEAFTIRNIANLVPPFENDPSETSAGLEFAVNSLEVGNIFIIGHSCCGGIRALMSMQDEADSSGSFIRDWVVIGKTAKLRTKAAAANLSFDQQCKYCEKESVNRSLLNLLTYPWIEERVSKGILCLHGGYYDFVKCTFEKWTLDYKGSMEVQSKLAIKNYESWGA